MLKPCANPTCPKLTTARRCPEHEQQHARAYRQVRPDDTFYRTHEWRALRAEMLAYAPYCACGAKAIIVDHITPIRAGGAPLDARNLQTMCWSCHSRKTRGEQ